MGNVISNLKAKFGVDNSDFKKGLKEGEQAIGSFKGSAGGMLDEFATMFGVNMSGVNDAVGTAGKSLGFLKNSFVAAAKGGDVLTISAKVLKFALVSTGLGALIVLLGSVITYFMKSGEGSDKFAKILMQVKSVVNNVIDRLAVFGKGLMQILTGKFREGWETMTGAFKGMGDEIKEDWKAAGDLADRLDALDDREIKLIKSLEERKAKAAELRLLAKEETEDQKKKLSLLQQAEALYKSIAADQIDVEQERLAIMKEQLAMQTSDPTDDQRREVAEQEAKINQLLRERDEILKGLIREKNSALNIVNEEVALEKAKNNQIAITKAEISNIEIPDLSAGIQSVLIPLAQVQASVKTMSIDISKAFNDAFTDMAGGMGEFLGSLMIGEKGMKDFASRMVGAFADLAITVGKLIIAMAIAKAGIEKAISIPGAWPIALAAGVALVALGSALKGTMKAASGSGGGASVAAGAGVSSTYDTRGVNSAAAFPKQIELVATGGTLRAVLDFEDRRKEVITGRTKG